MPAFKDNEGREWLISLDAPKIKAVREDCDGLDLMEYGGNAYDRLADDPCLLVDCLWVLCRKQARESNVTDEQFGRALVGDCLEAAVSALTAAVLDFFPKRRRQLVAELIRRRESLASERMAKAMAKLSDPTLIERLTAEMDREFENRIESALTRLSNATSSPDSVASTPKGEPSKN